MTLGVPESSALRHHPLSLSSRDIIIIILSNQGIMAMVMMRQLMIITIIRGISILSIVPMIRMIHLRASLPSAVSSSWILIRTPRKLWNT